MNPKLLKIMSKWNIETFNFEQVELFKFVLITPTPAPSGLMEELKREMGGWFELENKTTGIASTLTAEKAFEDKVNHPSHYNLGKIEVIEAIEDWKLSYHQGNAVKYIARAGKKDAGKELEDLKKRRAGTWIERLNLLKREIK